jgi:hypothetical protein
MPRRAARKDSPITGQIENFAKRVKRGNTQCEAYVCVRLHAETRGRIVWNRAAKLRLSDRLWELSYDLG